MPWHVAVRHDPGETKVFAWFESKPIASGSIAQIHKAVLNGEVVAVKVRFATKWVQFSIQTERVRCRKMLQPMQ